MSLSGNVTVGVNLQTKTVDSAGGTNQKLAALGTAARSIANGSGANQGTKFWESPIVLVASTPQTFDLTALPNGDGTTTSFAAVKGYFFDNVDGTDGDKVTFKPAAATPITRPFSGTTPGLELCAGSPVYLGNHLATGWPVGTAKSFTLDPGAAGQTVNAVIWGD